MVKTVTRPAHHDDHLLTWVSGHTGGACSLPWASVPLAIADVALLGAKREGRDNVEEMGRGGMFRTTVSKTSILAKPGSPSPRVSMCL